ncbi:cysteine desulfurase [Micromonospora rosaria]|uniref:Cysteine desulfurase n=1 Tax=Micromonospora rosaria TaxID=47874 RepID=A0A136PVE9_9ACTN|nr:aminotransferase class V-fold PLP-dependent enzyme [Micromonospora rosaria]KXK62264.1 cysteine desulfurase [Micromonospora rosaria]
MDVLGVPGQINLDYAASAPCVRAAADAVSALLPWYASVHRGAGALSRRCTLAYEQARQTVADFVGARADDHVVFTRNTTDALNLLARAVPAGTTVVTFAGEHHANLLPWPVGTVRLPVPSGPAQAVRALDAALTELRRSTTPRPTAGPAAVGRETVGPKAAAEGPAAGRPVLVAVTGASNVTGEVWPVAELARVARRHGARIVVDAAQLAPHAPVDLAALDVDYLALSGHKLYAPFGTGVLVGRADWLDAAPPYLAGGGATEHVGAATHDVRWTTGPARHEAGTPNLLGAVALAAVCAAFDAADRGALHDREQALLARLRSGLAALPHVVELHTFGPDVPRVGIVSFVVAGRDSASVAADLARDHAIGVRDGLFCAHPLARRLLAEAAARSGRRDLPPTAVRASLGLGSTPEQVDRLLAALATLA